MILYIAGPCEVGKGAIAQAIYDEGKSRGEDIKICLDPMEAAAMDTTGKPFSHLVTRRQFATQRGLARTIYDRARAIYTDQGNAKVLIVNESPLSFLATITFYGFMENVTAADRFHILTGLIEDANIRGTRHLVVQAWGAKPIEQIISRLTLASRDLARGRTFTLEPEKGYNETVEAGVKKAREVLRWEVE